MNLIKGDMHSSGLKECSAEALSTLGSLACWCSWWVGEWGVDAVQFLNFTCWDLAIMLHPSGFFSQRLWHLKLCRKNVTNSWLFWYFHIWFIFLLVRFVVLQSPSHICCRHVCCLILCIWIREEQDRHIQACLGTQELALQEAVRSLKVFLPFSFCLKQLVYWKQ